MGMLDKSRAGLTAESVISLAEPVAGTAESTSMAALSARPPAVDPIGPQRAAPRSVAAIAAESKLIASWLADGVPVVSAGDCGAFGVVDENGRAGADGLGDPDDGSLSASEPSRIDLPPDLAGPCEACVAVGGGKNPLFWEDRWGKVRCCGCERPPSMALFKRLLVMRRGLAANEITGRSGGILEFWFVEAEEGVRNPWTKGAIA